MCTLRDLCHPRTLTTLQEEELKTAVLVVLANKQDIPGCMNIPEMTNALGLAAIKNRRYQIFKTSAIKGEGLNEAMDWYVRVWIHSCAMLVGSF